MESQGGLVLERKTKSAVLRERLENATGQPEEVIAVNLDVRGFSSFCERNESINVVRYIREAYKNLMDEYFPQALFAKPTGDGLLIASPYEQRSLAEAANHALKTCQRLHQAFPSLVDDSILNIKKPQKIGIGLSRGVAFRIVANGETLDYSGRVLNRASRLMSLARPSGIVFDCEYLAGLALPTDLDKTFSKSKVWLWGMAERDPIEIYYSRAYGTRIPHTYRKRLDVRKWATERAFWPLGSIEASIKADTSVSFRLAWEPGDPDEIAVAVLYTKALQKRWNCIDLILPSTYFYYDIVGGEPRVSFHAEPLVELLRADGFSSKDKCIFVFKYPR